METSSDSSTRYIFFQFADCHRDIFSKKIVETMSMWEGSGASTKDSDLNQIECEYLLPVMWCHLSGSSGLPTCDCNFTQIMPPADLFAFQLQGRYFFFSGPTSPGTPNTPLQTS